MEESQNSSYEDAWAGFLKFQQGKNTLIFCGVKKSERRELSIKNSRLSKRETSTINLPRKSGTTMSDVQIFTGILRATRHNQDDLHFGNSAIA